VDADNRGHEAYRFLVEGMGAEHAWQEAVWRDDASALTGSEPPDATGRTPFSRTFYKRELPDLMLEHGADPATKNAPGKTYEEVQAERQRPE